MCGQGGCGASQLVAARQAPWYVNEQTSTLCDNRADRGRTGPADGAPSRQACTDTAPRHILSRNNAAPTRSCDGYCDMHLLALPVVPGHQRVQKGLHKHRIKQKAYHDISSGTGISRHRTLHRTEPRLKYGRRRVPFVMACGLCLCSQAIVQHACDLQAAQPGGIHAVLR